MASTSSFAFLLLTFLLSVNFISSYATELKPLFKEVCKSANEEDKHFCSLYLRSSTIVDECSDKECLVNGTVSDAYYAAQECVKIGEEALNENKLPNFRDIKPTEVCLENFKSVVEILHGALPLVESGRYELIEEPFKKAYHKTERCVVAFQLGTNPYNLGMRRLLKAMDMGTIVITFQPPK